MAAAFLAGAFLAGASSAGGLTLGYNSRILRTTGGSNVEEADLTNSPRSWILVSSTLLSRPSSFASSYTRTLATSLLRGCAYVAKPVKS